MRSSLTGCERSRSWKPATSSSNLSIIQWVALRMPHFPSLHIISKLAKLLIRLDIFLQKNFRSSTLPRHNTRCGFATCLRREPLTRNSQMEKPMRTLLLAILMTGTGAANDAKSKPCTDKTIEGSYGYTFIGSRPTFPVPDSAIVEGRGVGIRIFDGQGNFTQIDSIKSVNRPALVDQSASGTYKVNSDCTGTLFLNSPGAPGPAEFRFVIVRKGKEVFFTLVNPIGPMTLTHAIRQ